MTRFLVALVLVLLAAPALAQPKPVPPVKPAASFDIGKAIADANAILVKIETDAEFALTLTQISDLPEQAQANALAAPCYQAIDVTAKDIQAKLAKIPTDLPTPALITVFQINRMVVKQVINGVPTPIAQGCAALAQDVKADVAKLLVNLVGVTALKTLAGGVVLPPVPIP